MHEAQDSVVRLLDAAEVALIAHMDVFAPFHREMLSVAEQARGWHDPDGRLALALDSVRSPAVRDSSWVLEHLSSLCPPPDSAPGLRA